MQTIFRPGRTRAAATLAIAGTLTFTGLTGCGGTDAAGSSAAPATTPSPAASAAAAALTVKDPWVKASDAGKMTAAFGTRINTTGADVTVAKVASPASPMELHEMAMQDGKMVMRPKDNGFVIKANGTHELAPGGDHLMLMNPKAAIKAGDQVEFTLTLGDGTSVAFTAIAKPFAGAQESYAPGMSMPASGMPMAPMGSATP